MDTHDEDRLIGNNHSIVRMPVPDLTLLSGNTVPEFPQVAKTQADKQAAPSARALVQQPIVTLGHDTETNEQVFLGDSDRRGGCYVLGRSGTGKSSLLLRLIDHDTQQGHGVFFLDPHGDAIEDLLLRGDFISRLERARLLDAVRILDPEDETHSFGINLFACRDSTSLLAREATYKRAYEVFRKLWEHEWGLWLQSIIANTLPVFIENPQYTLVDVPRFLVDPAFRNHLLGKVTHFWEAALFWQHEFAILSPREQHEQIQPLLTRTRTLLSRRTVRDIINQRETTIDFAEILDKRQIILLKLSENLPADSKKL